MKKILFAILAISVICFAASTEKCNLGTTPENTDVNLPLGWCRAEGFVCGVTTESSGGVRFSLGKNSKCKKTEVETTMFNWHPVDANGNLNTSISSSALVPYLEAGPVDDVSSLTLAVNTAFIINASNEKFKVNITYHRYGNRNDQNSIRLLGISRVLE